MLKNVLNAGVSINKHHILYYGTDVSQFERKKTNHPKQPFTFVQISSFAEKKGHQTTLRAYRKFLDSDPPMETQLIFGGGGEGMDKIKNLTIDLKLENHVQFKGWVNIAAARDLLEIAHAFLHHSIVASNGDMEGIPNAIMEAMAMKLPVISTIHSGIPELVEDGVNGYLVEENDIRHYAQRMKDILSWEHLNENRQKVLDKFEKENHGQELIKFYQSHLM